MEMDLNSQRAILKKFPRFRAKQDHLTREPHNSVISEKICPNICENPSTSQPDVSQPSTTSSSSIWQSQFEKKLEDPYNLERLRSLSPGKSFHHEQREQNTPYECFSSQDPPIYEQYDRTQAGQPSDFQYCRISSLPESKQSLHRPPAVDSSSLNRYRTSCTSSRVASLVNPGNISASTENTTNLFIPAKESLYSSKMNYEIFNKQEYSCDERIRPYHHEKYIHKFSSGPYKKRIPSPNRYQVTNSPNLSPPYDYVQQIQCPKQTALHNAEQPKFEKIYPRPSVVEQKISSRGETYQPYNEETPSLHKASPSEIVFNQRPSDRYSYGNESQESQDYILQTDAARYSDLSSCPTSPDTAVSSDDSINRYSPTRYQPSSLNEFQSAHYELLLETPPPLRKASPLRGAVPSIGDPPDLIPLSGEKENNNEDYLSERSSNNEDSLRKRLLPDTANMTSGSILELIQETAMVPQMDNNDLSSLSSYLESHEVGHLNHLIKCYADSLFSIYKPALSSKDSSSNAVYFMNVHLCGLVQIYYILFKSEDFLDLSLNDQGVLLECGMLPALISLGIPLYKPAVKGWTLPNLSKDSHTFFLSVLDLNDLMDKGVVDRTLAIYELCNKLSVDWPISMLFLMIFLFTPANRLVEEAKRIDMIRTNYVKLLLKYVEWKHGPINAANIFPELLKLMDAILRHCQEIENLHLTLNEEEIESVYKQFDTLNLGEYLSSTDRRNCTLIDRDKSQSCRNQSKDNLGYLSYYSLHSKLSSILVEHLKGHSKNKSPVCSNELVVQPPTLLNLSQSE